MIGTNNPRKNSGELKQKGQVTEVLPGPLFRITLESGQEVLGHLAGKLRLYHVRILAGDKVIVELSPYDSKRGRIIYRTK